MKKIKKIKAARKLALSEQKISFPSYKNPPINEVVCGLRFQPSEKFRIPHIGLLWEKFMADYPNVEHAAPLISDGGFTFDPKTGLPPQRVWFINNTGDALIQFQADRLYFNWRRRNNDYPHFSYVIKKFKDILIATESFFTDNDLCAITPLEYELSYINHIPNVTKKGEKIDISEIVTDFVWSQKGTRFLPKPDNMAWKASFLLPESKGRISISLKEAIRSEDKLSLFVLELTARGTETAKDETVMLDWFETAHEWIVRGFTDITTPAAHKLWGKGK